MSADMDRVWEGACAVRLRRLSMSSRFSILFTRSPAPGRAEKELDDSESDDSGAVSRLDLCFRTGLRTGCSTSLSELPLLGVLPLEAVTRRVVLRARDLSVSSSRGDGFAESRTNCWTAMGPWSGHERTLADSFLSCSTLCEASREQYLPFSTAMLHLTHWM
jgi:hypothetical protein